jgi:chaperonin GroES
MTTFTPRNDNVLVLPDEAETMKGKLYIPESAVQRITRGTVVAVGPGYLLADGTRSEMDLKEGMRVEFHAQPGHPIIDLDEDDGPYCVFKEVEIIGIITDEPAAEMVMPEGDAEEDADELAKVG